VAKKVSSDFLALLAFILLKKSSLICSALTPLISTLVEVGITVLWLTLLRGTPLILKGPVTKRSPDLSCFKKTTLFPLNLPTKRIKTVPGVIFLLRATALGCLAGFLLTRPLPSVGYHFETLTEVVLVPVAFFSFGGILCVYWFNNLICFNYKGSFV